ATSPAPKIRRWIIKSSSAKRQSRVRGLLARRREREESGDQPIRANRRRATTFSSAGGICIKARAAYRTGLKGLRKPVIDKPCRGDVLDGEAQGLEDRRAAGGRPGLGTGEDFAGFGVDRGAGQNHVAGLLQRSFARVDDHHRRSHQVVVELPPVRPAGPDG